MCCSGSTNKIGALDEHKQYAQCITGRMPPQLLHTETIQGHTDGRAQENPARSSQHIAGAHHKAVPACNNTVYFALSHLSWQGTLEYHSYLIASDQLQSCVALKTKQGGTAGESVNGIWIKKWTFQWVVNDCLMVVSSLLPKHDSSAHGAFHSTPP